MEQQLIDDEAARAAHDAALLSVERERIAHELHRRVIRDLLAITLELDSVASRVDGDPQSRLVELGRSVERVARELRATVFALTRVDDETPIAPVRATIP